MVLLERLTQLSARSILEFIQTDSAKACTGWFIGKCMDQAFGDPRYSNQLKNMNTINKELEKMKQDTSSKIKVKTHWDYLNTRIFQAEMGICHKFQLMQTIMSNENSMERRNEALTLRTGILDANCGVLSNLAVIHQVLVGKTATNPTEKGLLEMWSAEIFNNMSINSMSAKTYLDFVDKYMTQAAILQFKGFLLFTGANTHSRFCLDQFELFENNLKYQIDTMTKTVPSYLKYLSDPDEKNVFVIRSVVDDDCEPFVRRRGFGKKLVNEYFCGNIEEGKWNFERSSTFEKDGSLLISGSSTRDGKIFYMRVSETNTAECVSEKFLATPFCVIPLDFQNQKIKINIRETESKTQRFLGNSLTLVNGQDDIEFTLSFDCV